jgi:methionyl-tRNA synthetase
MDNKMLADVIDRSKKLLGASVEFTNGLDEHGQKEQ